MSLTERLYNDEDLTIRYESQNKRVGELTLKKDAKPELHQLTRSKTNNIKSSCYMRMSDETIEKLSEESREKFGIEGKQAGMRLVMFYSLFDFSQRLVNQLRKLGYRNLIPSYGDSPRRVSLHVDHDGEKLMSSLEHCYYMGQPIKSYVVESVSEALYILGLYGGKDAFDEAMFYRLKQENAEPVIEQSQQSSTDNSAPAQQSTTEKPKLPSTKSGSSQITIPSADGSIPQQTSAIRSLLSQQSSTDDLLELLRSIEFHQRAYLPAIHETLLRIEERQIDVVEPINTNSIIQSIQSIIDDVKTPPDQFDNRNYLSKDAESFLLNMFNRIDEIRDGNGDNKADAYRKTKSEMDIAGSEFERLKLEYVRSRNNGKTDVTYYNIEEYYTQRYQKAVMPDGTIRIVKNHEVDKKKKKGDA